MEKRKPLRGITVLAAEQYIAGPYCTMLLADAGAEVIKVERPGSGDPRRTIGPYLETSEGKRVSGGFLEYNRNKKSLSLNLKSPRGQGIFRELATNVDVLVENFLPGTLDKMGLGYKHLNSVNPRLVYAAISGFGQLEEYEGPYSQWPAFDIVSEAMGGVMHMIGFADRPPITTIYGLADTYSGLITAYGIMLALRERELTGVGQFVDTSMYDAMVAINERAVATYALTGQVLGRGKETLSGPRGAFLASDGYVALNIPTDDLWRRLATMLGRPELVTDPRTKDGPSRAANDAFVREVIEEWMSGKTKEQAVTAFLSAGVPAGQVQTAKDLFSCPHVAARKMLVEVSDPDVGTRKFARTPARLSGMSEVEGRPAPRLGGDTSEILGRLGYSESQIADLKSDGVV